MRTLPTGASSRRDLVRLAERGEPLPSPTEAYFEVANRCNSKCATCPFTFSPQEPPRQLSLDEFIALVEQLPDLRRAVMQGIGEPLLNRDLATMIAHLKAARRVRRLQHERGITDPTPPGRADRQRLDELRVSLDGSTPETYFKVRGIPVFDRVVANVAEMVQHPGRDGAVTRVFRSG